MIPLFLRHVTTDQTGEPIRLQKLLAATGSLSRRQAEACIQEGRVTVNGVLAEIGMSASRSDEIRLDGAIIQTDRREQVVVAFNKPLNYVTSRKKTAAEPDIIYDILPQKFLQLRPVGRLDKDTTGLLLLTNDGKLIEELTHPRYEHTKIYEALLRRPPTALEMRQLSRGELHVLGRKMQPAPIVHLGGRRVAIALTEGRNRQVRRMFRTQGNMVEKMRRVAIGGLYLKSLNLDLGQARLLSTMEYDLMHMHISAHEALAKYVAFLHTDTV